jgi:uncharacterized protein YbbC (DUF1343 family)
MITFRKSDTGSRHDPVRSGLEVFLSGELERVRSKRVGLITNPTAVDSGLRSAVNLFIEHPDIELVALYGPEHGVRGNAQAGEHVPFYRDPKSNLPVYSLYGQTLTPPSLVTQDADTYMRAFDTVATGKLLEQSMVRGLDVLVFDLQDVGTRIYTYIATMAYCMEASAENDLEFIVLDRPNPINGIALEGPLVECPQFRSFVGVHPIPVRHGMTIGELAQLFRDRFMDQKPKLTVVPMQGWRRDMWFDDTDLPWVSPSPNLPTLTAATVYPGQVFLEGTNLSEGRGTTLPFELFGAPWIDGHELTSRLNTLLLPGIVFRESSFTPNFSKHTGSLCAGAQLHVVDRNRYQPLVTTLHILATVMEMYPAEIHYHADYFDRVMGTSSVREGLQRGVSVEVILAAHAEALSEFRQMRKPYLLYKSSGTG